MNDTGYLDSRYYRYVSAGSVQYSAPGSGVVWRSALDPATRLRYFYTGSRAEWSLPTLDTGGNFIATISGFIKA